MNYDIWHASEFIFFANTHSSDKIWASQSVTFMLLVLLFVLFYPFPTLKTWMWWGCDDFVKPVLTCIPPSFRPLFLVATPKCIIDQLKSWIFPKLWLCHLKLPKISHCKIRIHLRDCQNKCKNAISHLVVLHVSSKLNPYFVPRSCQYILCSYTALQ